MTAPLWDYLDKLTPTLWREGRAYPATGTAMFPLIADGEIDLSISFSPGAATAGDCQQRIAGYRPDLRAGQGNHR